MTAHRYRIVKTDGGAFRLSAEQRARITALGAELVETDGSTERLLGAALRDADGAIVMREPFTAAVLAAATRLRLIARVGVGLDTIDLAAADAAGISVSNVPDANYHEVATHALSCVLALTRRLPHFDASVRAGRWLPAEVASGMRRLDELTLGIVGFGRSGRRLAAMAVALGLHVIVHSRRLSTAEAERQGVSDVDLGTLLSSSDVVSIHVPANASTRHLIDAEAVGRMRTGAVLVNVARGGIVDEAAVADALHARHLAGAAFDVFESEPISAASPLLEAPGVIMTPHVGYLSEESLREAGDSVIAEIGRHLRGEPLRNLVNRPDHDRAGA